MAKRIIRLTESDLEKLIRRVVKEEEDMSTDPATVVKNCIESNAPSVEIDISTIPQSCKNVVSTVKKGGTPETKDVSSCASYVGIQISSLGLEALRKAPVIIDCIQKGLKS